MSYIECSFNLEPYYPFNEILIAALSEFDFESFTEEDPILKAYIQTAKFKESDLEQIDILKSDLVQVEIDWKELPKENWNKKWESNFERVEVEDFCLIRAPFHESDASFKYELLIEPKMSFGTGHHDTTQLMIRQMKSLDLEGKSVLDMGSGTGVLAILADKMKAKSITAIDIEEWAFENIQENIERNQASRVKAYLGGLEKIEELSETYDLILANINKNILFDQLPTYFKHIKQGGIIMLSGFFPTDVEDFHSYFENTDYKITTNLSSDQWTSLKIEER